MDGPGLAAIAVIRLSGAGGEYAILKEEGLIARHPLFKEVSLLGLLLSPKAFLMQEGVKLPLRLSSDVVI